MLERSSVLRCGLLLLRDSTFIFVLQPADDHSEYFHEPS